MLKKCRLSAVVAIWGLVLLGTAASAQNANQQELQIPRLSAGDAEPIEDSKSSSSRPGSIGSINDQRAQTGSSSDGVPLRAIMNTTWKEQPGKNIDDIPLPVEEAGSPPTTQKFHVDQKLDSPDFLTSGGKENIVGPGIGNGERKSFSIIFMNDAGEDAAMAAIQNTRGMSTNGTESERFTGKLGNMGGIGQKSDRIPVQMRDNPFVKTSPAKEAGWVRFPGVKIETKSTTVPLLNRDVPRQSR